MAAPSLSTFNALYANGVAADDLVVKAATTALQTGLINGTQASKVLTYTDAIKTALDAANGVAQGGNLAGGTANLAAALGPVATLSACLASRPLTPSTFDTCISKLTPPVST